MASTNDWLKIDTNQDPRQVRQHSPPRFIVPFICSIRFSARRAVYTHSFVELREHELHEGAGLGITEMRVAKQESQNSVGSVGSVFMLHCNELL